jgi:hypothetical protein
MSDVKKVELVNREKEKVVEIKKSKKEILEKENTSLKVKNINTHN